jgi:hypothetical protein
MNDWVKYRRDADLLPDPTDSEDQARRFFHHDLAQLSAGALWAETTLLTHALATRIFRRVRVVHLYTDGDGYWTDEGWMRARLARLKAEARNRHKGRAA